MKFFNQFQEIPVWGSSGRQFFASDVFAFQTNRFDKQFEQIKLQSMFPYRKRKKN